MKTIVIYHSRDLDGQMSAAIVKKWYLNPDNKQGQSVCDYANPTRTNIRMDMLGWDYGDDIPDLSGYEKVIMVDVAFPIQNMCDLTEKSNRKEIEFIWIDHHISAINDFEFEKTRSGILYPIGLRDDKFAACELTWRWFFPKEEIPEIVRLLGMYDSFRHKGTDEEQKVLEFQYGARTYMSNYEDCYDTLIHSITDDEDGCTGEDNIRQRMQWDGEVIYKYLIIEARQTYKKAFPIEFGFKFKKPEPVTVRYKDRIPIKFLCVNQERFNPVNFGIDYHKEGYDGFACFWYKDGKWHWSLYNDNGDVDCSVIAKQYGGGGHFSAAGMVLSTEKLLYLLNQ